MIIKYGLTERSLAAKRGAVRTFSRFETLVGYLKGIGIADYHVNASNFDATIKVGAARPDSANRLKTAHEAAAYDKWFQQEVTQAITEANNPNTEWVTHDVVKADVAKQHAALKARIAGLAK